MPLVDTSKRLVLINASSAFVNRILNLTVLLWLHWHLLSRISTDEYSLLAVVGALMMFPPLLTGVLTSGLGRYAMEAYAKGNEGHVTVIVSTMFPLLLGLGAVMLAVGGGVAWHIDSVLNIAPERLWDARIMMGILVLAIGVRLPLAPFEMGFYITQKYPLMHAIGIGTKLFQMTLLLALILGVSTKVVWVVLSQAAANMLNTVILVILSVRMVPQIKFRRGLFDRGVAREISTFGGWNTLLQIANTIRESADPLILNRFATPLDVANYNLGAMAALHIRNTAAVLTAPLSPTLTAMHAMQQRVRLASAYIRGGRYALWGVLGLALPMMMLSPELARLYAGEQYGGTATVMVLLMLRFPLYMGSIMMIRIAVATAQVHRWAVKGLLMDLFNLLVTLVLVWGMGLGAMGSALGSLIAAVVFVPFFIWPLGIDLANLRWKDWVFQTLLPGLVPAAVSALFWLGLRRWYGPETWLDLGFSTVLGWCVYGAVLGVFCLQPSDRHDLKELYKKISGFALSSRSRQSDSN